MNAAIDTAIIFTHRMRELADFYAEGLDLAEPNELPGHIGFQVGHVYLGFDQVADQNHAEPAVSLWFRVDDLDATFTKLTALGAEIIYEPVTKPWGDRLAAVSDLDGNRIGLSQR